MNETSAIVKKYRAEQDLSLSDFGSLLCEDLPGVTQSRQNIFNWESGAQRPPYYFCLLVMLTYARGDWRYEWALDILRKMKPELFAPDGILSDTGDGSDDR